MKNHVNKILGGMSIGIVVCLMPSALLGNLARIFEWTTLAPILAMSVSLMGLTIGLCVGIQYKFDAVSTTTLAIAGFVAGGALKGVSEDGFLLIRGSGDVLNTAIGVAIAIAIIELIGSRLKTYKILVLPAITISVVGIVCSLTAAPVSNVSIYIGKMISQFTSLQPITMSILIAISFATIIVSPISSVAIGLLININGIGSAAANIGICGLGITLALLSVNENGLGTSLTHFLGSPKIQMKNFLNNPKIIIPGLFSAVLCSISVPIFNLQGTAMSAGFGLSGLVGPLANLEAKGFTTSNVLITISSYIIIPVIISFISVMIFRDRLKFVKNSDYKVEV